MIEGKYQHGNERENKVNPSLNYMQCSVSKNTRTQSTAWQEGEVANKVFDHLQNQLVELVECVTTKK
jgi:hypothetical protein